MARRQVTMNEIVEMVFQWHQEAGLNRFAALWDFSATPFVSLYGWLEAQALCEGIRFPPL